MQPITPTAVAGASDEGDLLVSIPRPRWTTIRRVSVFGFSLLFSVAVDFVLLNDLIHRGAMTRAQRVVLLGFAGVSCFNAFIKAVLLKLSLKLPIEILKSGIAYQGTRIPWVTVEGCRWARYSPDTLEVRAHRLRSYFAIPRDQRDAVEAALRDVGKWQA
jgi:hypothetical protein